MRRVADQAQRLGGLAELTNPTARWVRDRVLMPLVGRVSGARAFEGVLQERPEALAAMCRA